VALGHCKTSRSGVRMAEELPGFIPRVLQLDDVSLLRADEAVLKAMADGWRAQMLTRGLATSTITARCSLIGRFVEFINEYPWRWHPLDLDQFLADLVRGASLRQGHRRFPVGRRLVACGEAALTPAPSTAGRRS
jgi:hypothetical protein